MKCNQCGTDNVEGTRYCMTCGSALETGQTQSQMDFQPTPQNPQPMPQNSNNPNNMNYGNGIACMVLGIVSIVFGCTPLIGLICGIIAIIMNRKDIQMGFESSYHKAGLICGIIGVCLGAIALIYWIIWASALACVASNPRYFH